MQESGKIIKIDARKNTATVEFDRRTDCDKCGMCMISKDKRKVSITLKNSVEAKLHDTVEVMMGSGYVLTAAAVVYVVPLILVGLALIITRGIAEYFQIAAVAGALVIGIAIAAFADRKLRNRKGFCPEIIKITEKSKEDTQDGEQQSVSD